MKESYSEGVASHTGPESCALSREAQGEALTGVHAGQPLSREKIPTFWRPTLSIQAEGNTGRTVIARHAPASAWSKTLRTHGNSSHGNREAPWLTARDGSAARVENPQGVHQR
jgi:hypothetical protein